MAKASTNSLIKYDYYISYSLNYYKILNDIFTNTDQFPLKRQERKYIQIFLILSGQTQNLVLSMISEH